MIIVTPGPQAPDTVTAVIEIPKGSRNKYEYDAVIQAIKLDRVIPASVVYPTDYGFIPGTRSPDGDHLDILVFVSEPTFPGCIVDARPIGVARMTDDKGADPKIIAVAAHDSHFQNVATIDQLDVAYKDEIRHFFENYKELEHKTVTFHGWEGMAEAKKLIVASMVV